MINKTIVNKLTKQLQHLESKLNHAHVEALADKYLLPVKDAIYDLATKANHELIPILHQERDARLMRETEEIIITVIEKLDTEVQHDIISIETEMHGLGVYSGYEYKRINECVYKKYVEDQLKKMLRYMR
jgi:hypothetical protein